MSDDQDEYNLELSQFENLSEDELYATLAPSDGAYSFDGRVSAGKETFMRVIRAGRRSICENYNANKSTIQDASSLVRILTDSVRVVITIAGLKVPAIPVALLLTKMGMERLCRTDSK